MINLSNKMRKKITEKLMSRRSPITITDCRDPELLKKIAEKYSVMPDDISISMTKRKSPSGNRVIKISLEQYVAVPGSMQKKPSGSGNARKRKPYATKKAAGETDEVPGYLPVITNGKYRDAMGFNRSSSAYLQVLSGDAGLSFKNGSSSMNGFPATYEKIKGHCVDEGIGKIHLPLLMMLYGILLQKFSSSPEKHGMDGTAAFFFPDLAKKTGKPHTGVKDIEAVTSSMEKLKNIVGIVDSGQKSSDIIPLLSGFKYDENRNTIQFSSPYMARIIREIQKESIRKDKYGSPVLNGDGEKQMLPAYSYLVDISIEKERNRKAAEIVMIIVALIERTGKHTPHIRAKTIVAHSSLLKGSLQNLSVQQKNIILRRSFSKAWELLRTKTKLSSTYKDIELPDPESPAHIPTCQTIDMVFSFPHKGKCTDS